MAVLRRSLLLGAAALEDHGEVEIGVFQGLILQLLEKAATREILAFFSQVAEAGEAPQVVEVACEASENIHKTHTTFPLLPPPPSSSLSSSPSSSLPPPLLLFLLAGEEERVKKGLVEILSHEISSQFVVDRNSTNKIVNNKFSEENDDSKEMTTVREEERGGEGEGEEGTEDVDSGKKPAISGPVPPESGFNHLMRSFKTGVVEAAAKVGKKTDVPDATPYVQQWERGDGSQNVSMYNA